MTKSKNPLLQRSYNEGFQVGYQAGIDQSSRYLLDRLKEFEQLEGVGPKTLDKLLQVFDSQYFEKKAQAERESNHQANNNQTTK